MEGKGYQECQKAQEKASAERSIGGFQWLLVPARMALFKEFDG
jgi:hypothetical protein